MSSSTKPGPAVPASVPLADALSRSQPLVSLRQRLAESEARFAAVVPVIPPGLRAHVMAGPVDANGWTLLAANASVAAKLRQLEPALNERLQLGPWQCVPVRIKVHNR